MQGKGTARIDLDDPAWLALVHVRQERTRQDLQYGSQRSLSPDRWLSVLAREFCEAGNEANEHFKGRATDGGAHLRAELVQLAAVAVAWIEALDTADTATQPDPCIVGTCDHA